MGYYSRILTPSTSRVPVDALHQTLRAEGLSASINVEGEANGNWQQLAVCQPDGQLITVLERNEVAPSSLGEEEIAEFLDNISDYKPEKAVQWLKQYLGRVKVIYAFQHFQAADQSTDRAIFDCIRNTLWSAVGGIFQADGEGFSNEEGYHILWQFLERADGAWKMGLLDEAGRWVHFEMDLGNPRHRETFTAGRVPEGCRPE